MTLVATVLCALAITACARKPYVLEPPLESLDTAHPHQLFIVSHGWHTGLIIPARYLNQAMPELKDRFGEPAYYELGWGDKGFYQAQKVTSGLTLQAMFWSEGAIMHVVAVPGHPSRYFAESEVLSTCVTDAQLAALSAFVSSSFARDDQGRLVSRKPGIYGNSQFYDGEGRYDILNTCNTWTAKGLRSVGVDISPAISLTSESVMHEIRAVRRSCTLAP